MGAPPRRRLPALIEAVAAHGPGFEFFQALRLAERLWPGQAVPGSGLDGRERLEQRLRLRAAPEISFPAGDIRRAGFDDQGRLVLELAFLGLYGVDAPMPGYFLERVAAGDEGAAPLRDFLDLFNHRFYVLFYQAWRKYRPHLQPPSSRQEHLYRLAALSGHAAEARETPGLAAAGLLGARVRGAGGLVALLRNFLPGSPVTVRTFVPSWVRVDGIGALGEGPILGDDTLVGDRVLDLGGKIEIHIGPVDAETGRSLLPAGSLGPRLAELVRAYLDPTLRFDVVLEIRAEGGAVRLGDTDLVLGWSTWLGRPARTRSLRVSDRSYRRAGSPGETGTNLPRVA